MEKIETWVLNHGDGSEDEREVRTEGTKASLSGEGLAAPQKIHAFAILVLPTFGFAYAIWRAFEHGIGTVELVSLAVMYSVSWIGITVGYHRHFSHRSFQAVPSVHAMLGIFGSMACQGPLNYWVANHRRHHQRSDKEGDIHSPYVNERSAKLGGIRGFWHSHIGWTFTHPLTNTAVVARDVLKDKIAVWVHRRYYLWLMLGFVLPAAVAGAVTQSWEGAFEGFLWGGVVRLFLCYHSTNTITSLTHMWGNQPYDSRDQSRNNAWLAIVTWGESWHNNHHAFPSSAMFGQRWWQVDLGGIFIRTLQALGLAWDVRATSGAAMRRKMNVRAV